MPDPDEPEGLPLFIREDIRVLRSRVPALSAWDAAKNEAEHEANRPYWLKEFPVWK